MPGTHTMENDKPPKRRPASPPTLVGIAQRHFPKLKRQQRHNQI